MSGHTAGTGTEKEGNSSRKAPQRRRTTGKQTVVASPHAPEGTRQGRKQLEKGAAKETRKDTPAAPSFRLALFKRSQLALFCRAAPPFKRRIHISAWAAETIRLSTN